MSVFVETLNTAGRAFVDFALPMLIQSSLLIVALLLFDVVLRRRVRAVFRYWVWMLVLVKLVLPPSLGSPVSVGTWLGDELEAPAAALLEPAPEPPTPIAHVLSGPPVGFAEPYVPVSGSVVPSPPPPSPVPEPEAPLVARSAPAANPATATLSWQGLMLLGWATVVVALVLLLFQRALFVRDLAAQAEEAPAPLRAALDDCRARMGVRGRVSLKISTNTSSPAVCGLLHPKILIPRTLAPKLSGRDLQAVLLHELAHVKRGDLWINLVQTLLQIIYFYNPLLWLANVAIRRVREQGVDEAVLVAMGERAREYPDTLINVAKLAFRRRPALSLRLVGVVESKSALTGRIKHILGRPLPKSTRLGLLSLLIIVIVAAVVLPMAKARPMTDRARKIMELAEEEARALNHSYVGTEHILIALACGEP
jgi:beta-lactamase regulating signal transducer with metallopeptidase domain